jgi:transposase
MVKRGEITDRAWASIAPLLPEYGQPGGRWRDHRTVVNGILWKLRTGSPWRDLPERYGPWQTCYETASSAGGATAPGTACWPTRKRSPTRSAGWSGR